MNPLPVHVILAGSIYHFDFMLTASNKHLADVKMTAFSGSRAEADMTALVYRMTCFSKRSR